MADFLHSVPIDAKPEKVYAAVATQKGMRGWWTRDTEMVEQTGGKAEFGFEKRAVVFHMRIDALEPGRRVRMTCSGGQPEWSGTTLEWTIAPGNGSTILGFEHRGWRQLTPYAIGCNSMWGHLMFRIKKYVESGRADPQWKR